MSTRNGRYLVTNLAPQSPYAEAYRIVRTNILASPTPLRSIMVTSTRSGQGKTTVVANLAIVTAQMGKRLILVEADLRRPTLQKCFSIVGDNGLADVLSGAVPLQSALHETEIDGLLLLPAGTLPPNPAELLSSPQMRDLLLELRTQADLVLVDTPPIAAFSDPLVMLPYMDGVILAYRAGQVPRDVDARGKMQLESMQANILGVILTNVSPDQCDSYYYHYSYYRSGDRGKQRKREGFGDTNGTIARNQAPMPEGSDVKETHVTQSFSADAHGGDAHFKDRATAGLDVAGDTTKSGQETAYRGDVEATRHHAKPAAVRSDSAPQGRLRGQFRLARLKFVMRLLLAIAVVVVATYVVMRTSLRLMYGMDLNQVLSSALKGRR